MIASESNIVPIKDSIATKLLMAVFSLYLLVTVAVTLAHMYTEVEQARSEIEHDLKAIAETFEPSLAKALWDYNVEQLQPAFLGMAEFPTVVGVKLIDDKGVEVGVSGVVTNEENQPVRVRGDGVRVAPDEHIALFKYSFPIVYHYSDKEDYEVGFGIIYSSQGVVLGKVKLGFIFIIVNALIKTVALWAIFLWLSRSMLQRPLETLTAAAHNIHLDRLDDLIIQVKTKGRNELRVLEKAFNEMIQKLRVSRDQIEEKNKEVIQTLERIKAILDNTTSVIYMKDTDGRYILINRQYELLFGVTNEAIQGKTDFDIFPAEAAEAFRKNDLLALKENRPIELEEKAPHRDGIHEYISIKFPLHDASGKVNAICGISTDITERKKAEAILKDYSKRLEGTVATRTRELKAAKEEAEYANRAKTEFLANMSHDLRTPLNVIVGFAEMMETRTFGPLGDPHYEEYVIDIRDSGSLLINLIDDILDISKVEAGKYELYEETLDITSLIQSSVKMISTLAEARKLHLVTNIEPNIPMLRGDEKVITQILNNLLSNAIKFTPADGEITASAKTDEDGSINVLIADTGKGMSRHGITKALKPFEQTDGAHSKRHEGTGLGLYLCQKFIKLHGGDIKLQSKVGKGTTVTVRFPPERTVASR